MGDRDASGRADGAGGEDRPPEHGPGEFEGMSREEMIERLCLLSNHNDLLVRAARAARKELTDLRGQIDDMGEPPLSYAVFTGIEKTRDDRGFYHERATVADAHGRRVVPVSPYVTLSDEDRGRQVLLDGSQRVLRVLGAPATGPVRRVRSTAGEGRWLLASPGGSLTVAKAAAGVGGAVEEGDDVLVDPSGSLIVEILPREDEDDQVLEETPDVTFDDIGGLDGQIEAIRDAVELPFLKRDLYERFGLSAPRGVLLYGPPGNGKTMVAKAIAHALSTGFADAAATGPSAPAAESGAAAAAGAHPAGKCGAPPEEGARPAPRGVFLSLKGPEILSKYVGEAERMLRSVFARARERAAAGVPVVVFIDEMDSLLRTRGTGVSSDVETTIVPQFLAELDGVEELGNVIVIGASNRVDMIDPAVLRPGRLDVKIRIDRPGREQAVQIVGRYLSPDLPLEEGLDARSLARAIADDAYARDPSRFVCSVRMARGHLGVSSGEGGAWRDVYLGDLCSGAMLSDAVSRAKRAALKRAVTSGGDAVIGLADAHSAVEAEFTETVESLRQSAGSAGAVQWAQIMGLGGEEGFVVTDVAFTPSAS